MEKVGVLCVFLISDYLQISPRHVTTCDSIENDTLSVMHLFSRTIEDTTKFLTALEKPDNFSQSAIIFFSRKSFLRGYHILKTGIYVDILIISCFLWRRATL